MTRIVAGVAGGRRLVTPPGQSTRPTADRVREALASSLEPVAGLAVLDLCAGSGAVGLELLSRGAREVTLVDPATGPVLRSNVAALGLPGAIVVASSAEIFLRGVPSPHDIVFVDPPYALDVDPILALLDPWLVAQGIVVVERDRRSPEPTWPESVSLARSRRYGDTMLWYGFRS